MTHLSAEPVSATAAPARSADEMSSLERFEYFRPRILPPEPSDATPEPVSTEEGRAGEDEDYSRADHVHYAEIPEASDATPQAIAQGAGSAGTGADYSRFDHQHPYTPPPAGPSPYTSNPEHVTGVGSQSPGTSDDYARGNHAHALPLMPNDSELGPGLKFEAHESIQKLRALIETPLIFNGETGAIGVDLDEVAGGIAGPGLGVNEGKLVVQFGQGLKLENNALEPDLGDGLQIDQSSKITLRPGHGVTIDNGALIIKLDENPSLALGEGGVKVAPEDAQTGVPYKDENGNTKYMHFDVNGLMVDYAQTNPP